MKMAKEECQDALFVGISRMVAYMITSFKVEENKTCNSCKGSRD